MATFPLTQAPYWRQSSALLGASASVVATAAQGSGNGAQPAYSNVLQADSAAKFRPGTVALFQDESYGEIEAIYLLGVASLAQYDAVKYDTKANTTTRLITTSDATVSGPVAVALSNPNGSQYGWFAIRGQVPVSTASAIINESLAASGTAGQLTDANDTLDTAGNLTGINAKSAQDAPATGFTNCQLHYPWCWEK